METSLIVDLIFGDGGKGLVTDYNCSLFPFFKKIVVRFSGGPQAGHNVVFNGKTHVHSTFCSGTLRGYPSYISEYCSFSPTSAIIELYELIKKTKTPVLFLHPLASIITPMDEVFNQITEKINKHGSCGKGIGSTASRQINSGYKLFAVDLLNIDIFKVKYSNILNYYISKLPSEFVDEFVDLVNKQDEMYFKCIQWLFNSNKIEFSIVDYNILLEYDEIIFEGSQGILLDMDHGIFPNVTYANVTSKNAMNIIDSLKLYLNRTYYVTRCYQARHGNGWMSNNDPVNLINTEFEINKFNEWQGEFKIGEIDYDLINYSLSVDSVYNSSVFKNLVITCLDQRPGFEFDLSKINFKFYNVLKSFGPTAKDIVCYRQ